MIIKNIVCREVVDDDGKIDFEVEIVLENGNSARTICTDLNDNITKIEQELDIIKQKLIGIKISQGAVDSILINLINEYPEKKIDNSLMGAISLTALKVIAGSANKGIYSYVAGEEIMLPFIMMNFIDGGVKANNKLTINEFLLVPIIKGIKEKVKMLVNINEKLRNLLKESGYSVYLSVDGGYVPELPNNEAALKVLMKAIIQSGYRPGIDVSIVLNVKAKDFYKKDNNRYVIDNNELSADELCKYYIYLINKYPILSIIDPFVQDDEESFKVLLKLIGEKIMVVNSQFSFVTSNQDIKVSDAIFIKANNLVSHIVRSINLAKKNNLSIIVDSNNDELMADLVVGLCCPYIKVKSLPSGKGMSICNRLIRIEEELLKR